MTSKSIKAKIKNNKMKFKNNKKIEDLQNKKRELN